MNKDAFLVVKHCRQNLERNCTHHWVFLVLDGSFCLNSVSKTMQNNLLSSFFWKITAVETAWGSKTDKAPDDL